MKNSQEGQRLEGIDGVINHKHNWEQSYASQPPGARNQMGAVKMTRGFTPPTSPDHSAVDCRYILTHCCLSRSASEYLSLLLEFGSRFGSVCGM